MNFYYIYFAFALSLLASWFFYVRSKKSGNISRPISRIRVGLALGIIGLMAVFGEYMGFTSLVSPLLIAAGTVLIVLG